LVDVGGSIKVLFLVVVYTLWKDDLLKYQLLIKSTLPQVTEARDRVEVETLRNEEQLHILHQLGYLVVLLLVKYFHWNVNQH
jgi:hypothetical protein